MKRHACPLPRLARQLGRPRGPSTALHLGHPGETNQARGLKNVGHVSAVFLLAGTSRLTDRWGGGWTRGVKMGIGMAIP